MLNFIYYPVSAILWVWHKVFGAIPFLGPDSGITWALSVVFLVFTLRAVLYKPFVKQVRTTRQMQELQPQIKALQKKYSGDRQRQAIEMQKLQKEHGFNPIMGCLPVLGSGSGLHRSVPRASLVQPHRHRYRSAGHDRVEANAQHAELRLQRRGRAVLPECPTVRCTHLGLRSPCRRRSSTRSLRTVPIPSRS